MGSWGYNTLSKLPILPAQGGPAAANPRVRLQMFLFPSSWRVQQPLQLPAVVLQISTGGWETDIIVHHFLAVCPWSRKESDTTERLN